MFIHKVWKLYFFFLSASCLVCKWHRSTEISRGCQPLLLCGSYTTGRVHQPPCDVFMFLHTMFLHTIGDIPGSFPYSSYTIHISHEGNSVPLSDTSRSLGVEPQDYFSLSGEVTPYVYTVLVATNCLQSPIDHIRYSFTMLLHTIIPRLFMPSVGKSG